MCSPLPHDLVKHDHFPRLRESQIRVQKRRQFFVGPHNKTLSVIAMCVNHPDGSPTRINGSDQRKLPTAFLKIVCDDFPVFHFRAQSCQSESAFCHEIVTSFHLFVLPTRQVKMI
jgi:hypothetical protein